MGPPGTEDDPASAAREVAGTMAAVLRMRAVLHQLGAPVAERHRIEPWLDEVVGDAKQLRVRLTSTLDELTWQRAATGTAAGVDPTEWVTQWVSTGRGAGAGIGRRDGVSALTALAELPDPASVEVLTGWVSRTGVSEATALEVGTADGVPWASVELRLPNGDRTEDVLAALDALDGLGVAIPPDAAVGAIMMPVSEVPLRLRVAASTAGLTSVGMVSGPVAEGRLVALIRATAGDEAVQLVAGLQGILGALPPTAVEVCQRPDGPSARLTYRPSPVTGEQMGMD